MRMDVEHVRQVQAERLRINKMDLKDIEWYEGGKKLEVSPEVIKDFVFTGLCNTDFITMDVYKETSL